METGESERRKLQDTPPWVPVPATPLKPIVSRPMPIWTPEVGKQLFYHSNGIHAVFDPSASAEMNNWPLHRSEPPALAHHNAKTPLHTSFDIPSSSNSIAELWTGADNPFAFFNVTNEELLNQFVSPYHPQFNPTFTSFDHHPLLPLEQPFVNPIHNQYPDLPGKNNQFSFRVSM
ncbi:unnamed protein product [Sphenostylis stenocarpa]|uniref:Uncharacterized protein n=1 Tax=Sphenostylis stenocarpa TaxID=92480 RepID=A0AA86RQA3_9FABA|nr:unnamed protein product [Sphenostylis stenocarpa]